MAPKYKLTYFNFTGAAEPIRYIFAYANQEYEDVRINRVDWPEFKKNTPFGKVPVLEVDGKAVPQSNAIARYLAKQFGLTGKNDWDSLQCDVVVDTIGDLRQGVSKLFFEKDEAKKNEITQKLLKEDFPHYLVKLDKIVSDNGGYTAGSGVTWSDLYLTVALDYFEEKFNANLLEPYPALKALKEKINNLPNIKAYLAKRPANPAS